MPDRHLLCRSRCILRNGRALSTLAGLVVCMLAAGCTGESGTKASEPTLRVPGQTKPYAVSIRDTRANDPYSFGAMEVCLSRAGHATLTAVHLEGGSGTLVLESYALRPVASDHEELGDGAGPLTNWTGFHPGGGQALDGVCSDTSATASDHTQELGLQLSRIGDASASSMTLRLTYDNGSGARDLQLAYAFTLCAPADSSTPACRP